MKSRLFRPPLPVDLPSTLGPLRRGKGDPTIRIGPREVLRATRTPEGPGTQRLVADSGYVQVQAWGPGAEWLLDRAPALVGSEDTVDGFRPLEPLLRDLDKRSRGLRIGRSAAVVETLIPTILEQKVTGIEARRSWHKIIRAYGETAPGPFELMLPPHPSVLASVPYFELHPLGVERKRASIVQAVCSYAMRLEETDGLDLPSAYRRLRAVPGVGPWTAAHAGMIALGDPDAVVVGDLHLPSLVAWKMAGEPRADDRRMLELLEPYRGHRARVIRLLEGSPGHAPSYAPRLRLRAIERT